MVKEIKETIGERLYRLMEKLDGEKKHIHIIRYREAEKIKVDWESG